MIGIYKITCTQENKVYIGSSINIKDRWRRHKYTLNKGTHKNYKLQDSWDAYGNDSFIFSILEETKEIIAREQYYLNIFWPECYNISKITNNPLSNPIVAKKVSDKLKQAWKDGYMTGNSKLTKEEVIQIKEGLRDGISVKLLAETFKVSGSQIHLIKIGKRWSTIKVKGFTEGKNKTAKDFEDIIIAMYLSNEPVKHIADYLGLKSPSSIYDVLNRRNIQIKSKI